jgi:hypothetical protein
MASFDQQRHRMIERAVRAPPKGGADIGIILWERLAAELTVIIGDRGFASLYSRSINDAGAEFAWLEPQSRRPPFNAFKLLASVLETRAPAEAQAANAAVLNIFIDTLIVLIGELVTNSILREAWGDDVVNDAGTEHRT